MHYSLRSSAWHAAQRRFYEFCACRDTRAPQGEWFMAALIIFKTTTRFARVHGTPPNVDFTNFVHAVIPDHKPDRSEWFHGSGSRLFLSFLELIFLRMNATN